MRRLFIRDSDEKRNLSHLMALCLGILIALVIADKLVGLAIPYISIEPPLISSQTDRRGIIRFWDLLSKGIQPIVFTGSSQTSQGISPQVFNTEIQAKTGQVVNAVSVSFHGGVAEIQRELIQYLFIPNRPKAILYGIEARAMMIKKGYLDRVKEFQGLPLGYALSRGSDIERGILTWFLQHSSLLQYRNSLHDWVRGIQSASQSHYDAQAEDEYGFISVAGIGSRKPDVIVGKNGVFGFTPFISDPRPQQTLHDIALSCQQSDTKCILLNMPLHETSYQFITDTDVALYHSEILAAGLPIWDFNTPACRALLGDASFYDLNHLNVDGAHMYSKMIADVYAQEFLGVSVTGDATCARIENNNSR